jgi:hypothetical protein
MFKKNLTLVLITFFSIFSFWINNTFWATQAPAVNCYWLPGCYDKYKETPSKPSVEKNLWIQKVSNLIWNLIQYVAVFAVIALILSGLMYLISWWEEEKVKKAKSWIIWSLVWVILSVSAWWIINVLNNIVIK